MLRKIENIRLSFVSHIFTKGHVQISIGRKVYNFENLRFDKEGYRHFLLESHRHPFGFIAGHKTYWLFKEELYKDNDNLNSDDVKAILLSRMRMKEQKIKRAKSMTAGPAVTEKLRRGAIPDDTKLLIWQRDRGKCVKCGEQNELQFDHIIPVALGGASTPENLQILCGRCNRTKNTSIA